VFYGNIGSHDRLDFTVVGPAVNEASRIAALCRSAERSVLLSEAFVAAAYSCRSVATPCVVSVEHRGCSRLSGRMAAFADALPVETRCSA
jgi:adenylate cyclase